MSLGERRSIGPGPRCRSGELEDEGAAVEDERAGVEDEGAGVEDEGAAVMIHLCSTSTSPPLAAEVVERALSTLYNT